MAERTSGAPASGKDAKSILNLRISKRSYIFNIRRPFDYVRQFKVQKHSEGFEQLKRFASTGIKDLMKSGPHVPKMRSLPKPRLFSKTLLIVLTMLLIFVVGIGAYLMFLISSAPLITPPSVPGGSQLMLFSDYSDIVSYGLRGDAVGLASVRLDSDNITAVNVSLFMYSQPVVRRVVLVDLGGVRDEFTTSFASNLSALLKADGRALETMQIDNLPPSDAVYIIPSDYIPVSLVGNETVPGRLLDLTKKGGVLIFAGYAFTEALLTSGVYSTIINIDSAYLSKTYGLSFGGGSETPFSKSLGLALNTPLYSASGGSGSFNIYGSVLAASFETKGSMGKLVLIPQTLKRGWNNSAADAAQSFFKIIQGVDWNVPIARGNIYLEPPKPNERFSLVTAPFDKGPHSKLYPYLLAAGIGMNNDTYLRSAVGASINTSRIPQGKLSHAPVALPTKLSGQTLSIIGSDLSPTPVSMVLTARYNNNPINEVRLPEKYTKNLQYDYIVNLAPGDYVLFLSDTTGKVYAKSYLRVPVLTLIPDFYGWESGTFGFKLLQDDKVLAPGTTISGITASMDDGSIIPLSFQNGRLILQVPNAPVSAGTHTFNFDLGGTSTQTITETFTPPRNWWDETTYRLAILAVLCIFLIGYLLRRPDIALYSLDVPDFQPLSKLAIPIKRTVVLGIFDSVNREYKWKYMPLKVSEIKSGFRKIMHQGKGILIGDYNAERILDALLHEGSLKKLVGFYAPAKWEAEANHDIRYLAIFRDMRDVLVNNAVRFTDLNLSKNYDSMIGLGENGTMVQIYEPAAIGRIISGAQENPQLLLFANDAEKVMFEESLDSTSRPRIMLKMLSSSGRLSLVTLDELESFIKKASHH